MMKVAVQALILLLASPAQRIMAEAPNRPAPRELTNSIDVRLVLIPAGEFMMGGTESIEEMLQAFPSYKVAAKTDYLFQDEHPRHRVRITRPFYLGRCAVTVGQFKAFTASSGYQTEAERDGTGGWGYNRQTGKCEGRNLKYDWLHTGFTQTDDHPVVNVTWNDAVAFCRWLSRKEGRSYRLPREAEWEYACRAGTTTRYAGGDDPAVIARQANILDQSGRTEFPHVQKIMMPKDGRFTVPVGSYPASGFGLCDMHGNVWQWCADWYGKDYYCKSPVDDPTGPQSGRQRVRRGGGWNSFPLYARASFRNWNTPVSRCVNLGFRVLLESNESATRPVPAPGRPDR
jgi:formylglycine-generating enzyme required for sulfatase activity